MKRSEIEPFRKQIEEAHAAFVASVPVGDITAVTCLSPEEIRYAATLYRRVQELDERWFHVVQGTEPIEGLAAGRSGRS
jgi:hypothetical protein